MTDSALQDDQTELVDDVREAVGQDIDQSVAAEDPADVELLALTLAQPVADPELPEDVVALLPAVVAERGDELAAGVLCAMARLAPEPIGRLAAAERDELAARGVRSPLASMVGLPEVVECRLFCAADERVEVLGALIARPGDPRLQQVLVFVEYESCGGVVVDTLAGEPDDEPDRVRAWFRELDAAGSGLSEEVAAADIAKRLRAALDHMVDHELELEADLLPSLLLLQRALAGKADGWPRPLVAPPKSPEEEEEERLHDDAEMLLEAFDADLGEHAAGDAVLLEHGPSVAQAMLDWKIGYGDRRLTRWTHADVREFMLDWYPRKGDSDDESIAAVPMGVGAFLRFLNEQDLLHGGDADALATTVERVRERFESAARDPRNWGLAKSMVAQMRSEGVDPADQDSLDRWLEDFNARPFEERDRVLAPATDRMLAAAGPAHPRPRGDTEYKAKRRKQAKAARKRNRR